MRSLATAFYVKCMDKAESDVFFYSGKAHFTIEKAQAEAEKAKADKTCGLVWIVERYAILPTKIFREDAT